MSRILFIHPDTKLVEIYRRHLSPHFNIDSAQDGRTGMKKIKSFDPRMIVSEYELEHLSGLALLRYVRNHPRLCGAPFVFLTRADMPPDALGLGASGWVSQKEKGIENLLAHIYQNRHALYE